MISGAGVVLKGERKLKRTLSRRAWASYSERINGGELSADGWAVWVSESTRDWDEGLTSWAREEKGRVRRRGVGLAGLARLAVGRRGASRGMLLRACAELQGPGVRRGVREGQAAAWAGGTRLERPRRGSAEADRAGPRVWAVGLVTGPSWVGVLV